MFIKKIIFIPIMVLCFCSPNDSTKSDDTVNISEIIVDKTTISAADTVKFECLATASGTLRYHWDLSNIIEKANASGSFNYGPWIKWVAPATGSWTIEVLAYLSSADHPSTGGNTTTNWETYLEYSQFGAIQHCFDCAEQGELWDKKSITIVVTD